MAREEGGRNCTRHARDDSNCAYDTSSLLDVMPWRLNFPGEMASCGGRV